MLNFDWIMSRYNHHYQGNSVSFILILGRRDHRSSLFNKRILAILYRNVGKIRTYVLFTMKNSIICIAYAYENMLPLL